MKPEFELFTYPSQYRELARITSTGEIEINMDIEDLEKQVATAWDLQHRALARLILEIARLRAK